MFKTNLVEDCKKGKRKAQLKLYNQYCDAMLCVAMRYLKQKDMAEDAVQEAFIKAFKHIESFDGKTTFGAWLKRIVINQCIDYCRQLKYHDNIENVALEVAEEDNSFWKVEDHISTEDINNGIDNLPEKYSTILKLYLMEGYDHEEITEILNIKANNSRIQLHRGKKLLKEQLKSLRNERFA
ncbi:RNA polymerase sigma factor [Flavobacteriaceae bacterium 14752]|uniref:RNA polymerase sigma factor n=1 Tax=Mesohalobacter salilacus TaxID=2491711 RepID=UPI000F62C389|nr:RNA polymerase sigma factor [Flavobacteriaceae bacterium 14752]